MNNELNIFIMEDQQYWPIFSEGDSTKAFWNKKGANISKNILYQSLMSRISWKSNKPT